MRACLLKMASGWKVCRAGSLVLFLGLVSLAACSRSSQKTASSQSSTPAPFRIDDVELVGMQLGSADGGKTYRVAGQIKNDSGDSSISEVQLKIVLQDCLESGDCEVMAQETPTVQIEIPPGQARDFEIEPVFKDASKPKGEINWRYEVIAAKGIAPAHPGS